MVKAHLASPAPREGDERDHYLLLATYYLLPATYSLLTTYYLLAYLALAGGYERDESEAPAAHGLQTRPEVLRGRVRAWLGLGTGLGLQTRPAVLRGQGKGMVRVRDGVRSAARACRA